MGPLANVLSLCCCHGLSVKQTHLTKGENTMGHQETMATGSALRRILLVLAVAAVMAAMMAVSAVPAFAKQDGQLGPPSPRGPVPISKAVENACLQNVILSFCG
jgi:hypothetical protein